MTKKEFKKIAKVIAAAYGREELVEDKFIFNTWYKFLKDYSASHLKRIVNYWIKTEKYLPTIAELREIGDNGGIIKIAFDFKGE